MIQRICLALSMLVSLWFQGNVDSYDVALRANSIALVMGPTGIPTPSPSYLSTVNNLYLAPNGFSGTVEGLTTPELHGQTSVSLGADEYDLLTAVNSDVSQGDHVTVFGYSQSAAAASIVMYELAAEHISPSDVNFVLVGDSDSPYGILAQFIDSLPNMLRPLAISVLPYLDLQGVVDGPSTPGLYPTIVYTIPGDGFADWPTNVLSDPVADLQSVAGLFSTHLEYLGLTPEAVDDAQLSHVDGLTDYYTINPADVDMFNALLDAAVNVGYL